MADVFVSYKAEDRRRIKPLVDALEADGFSVWWDQQIDGGAAWRRMIETELREAKSVIVAWSKRSVGEDGAFVQDEATRAQHRHVYIPVTIEKVHLPLGFGETHALPLTGWHGDRSDPRYQSVLSAVRKLVGERHGRELSKGPRVNRRTAVAGGAAAAAAIAAAGGWALLKTSSAKANNRIAVLPFANLSGDPAQNYFADGLAEELRGALSRLGGLKVIGRVSSEAMRNSETTDAARKLGVGTLVIGSVRRSPSVIRVSAQLLDGNDGAEKWAETYDRAPGDVLAIQADIAENVARSLSIQLGGGERDNLTIGGTNNAAAHDLYLKAQAKFAAVNTQAGEREAIGLLDAAIALDPRFANALALKSLYLSQDLSTFGAEEANLASGYAEAERAARKAIEISPRLSLGYAALGGLARVRLEGATAVRMYERALAYNPRDSEALVGQARLLGDLGRVAPALNLAALLVTLDPLDPALHSFQSLIYYYARRYADAISAARHSLELSPQRYVAYSRIGDALVMLGRAKDAAAEYSRMPAEDPWRLVGLSIASAKLGDRASSDRALNDLVSRFGEGFSYQFAEIHAMRGEQDAAFKALDRAFELRDPGLLGVRIDPFLESIRSDARFAKLVADLHLP